ncbi:testicular spindle-associated protein SHCBP1L-like [Chanos chanos]|uniref:Testicular spindle-associated protein SHCBP1L-like n=1 Tax=Chanos chanos TaxID=29144 RepID=A0A6J2VAW3_CHACN|nr:testicular spindle-associated protein SHCBP1L [Chanos chanos]
MASDPSLNVSEEDFEFDETEYTTDEDNSEMNSLKVTNHQTDETNNVHTTEEPNTNVETAVEPPPNVSSPESVRGKVTMDQANHDQEKLDDSIEEAKMLPQIYTSKTLTQEEMLALYCDNLIRDSTVNFTSCDGKGLQSLQVTVFLAEPFSSNVANLPRELVEEVLKELNYTVPVLDVYPIAGQGSGVDKIAEALEHARFFNDVLWREWDTEYKFGDYANVIKKRIQLHHKTQNGSIPGPACEWYRVALEEYRTKRQELYKFQKNLSGEVSPMEAIECWKKYYEVMMHSGILKFWEDFSVWSHALPYPRIIKCKAGCRASGRTFTHVVALSLTTAMMKSFPPDMCIKQHDSLSAALSHCFAGDTVVIYPGEWEGHLAPLTDDIVIKGSEDKHEVVIISDPTCENFVTSNASKVTLQNLTLVQKGTCDGIVVVESGRMCLDNCVLKCEGTGVRVFTGASLIMTNCEVTGAQGAGVELYPGSAAELHGNEIHHCSKDLNISSGGICMKVIPHPQLKMSNNYLHDNQGYGVTVSVPENTAVDITEVKPKPVEADELSETFQKLHMEIYANKMEANSMGDIGLKKN